MLNIRIVTAAGEKSKGPYLLGSPMDSVQVSFGESFDTSAQKLLLSKKISVIPTFGRNNRESVSSACDSMPALQNTLSFDFNEGECALPGRSDSSGLPHISKSIPLSDGSDGHINHAQPLGIAYLNRVSVTNVRAASPKHVDSDGAKQESSSGCNKSVNVTTSSSIDGDTLVANEKPGTKRLKAQKQLTENNLTVASSNTGLPEVALSGVANTGEIIPAIISQSRSSSSDDSYCELTPAAIPPAHPQRFVERGVQRLVNAPRKKETTAAEQIVNPDEAETLHIRMGASQEDRNDKMARSTPNSLAHQRVEAASTGQFSNPEIFRAQGGLSHIPAHLGKGQGDAFSGSSRTGNTGEVGMLDSSGEIRKISEHRTVAVTPTMIEVGLAGGSHGWLKVRAELAGGAVHASVSSTSSSGEEMLHRELSSLSTYLQHEHVLVNSLVIHSTSANAQDFVRMGGGSDYGAATHQQQMERQPSNEQQKTPNASDATHESLARGEGIDGMEAWLPSIMHAGGGWLSVRA